MSTITLTNEEFSNFYDATINQNSVPYKVNKHQKAMIVAENLIHQKNLLSNDDFKNGLTRRIERFVANKPRNTKRTRDWCLAEFGSFEVVPKKKGRPSKTLGDSPDTKTEKKILDEIMHTIETHSAEQGISKCLLLKKLISTSKKQILNETGATVYDMNAEQATMLLYDINLSTRAYPELRIHLKDYGFDLPTRNSIDQFKHTLRPEIISEPLKAYVNYSNYSITYISSN